MGTLDLYVVNNRTDDIRDRGASGTCEWSTAQLTVSSCPERPTGGRQLARCWSMGSRAGCISMMDKVISAARFPGQMEAFLG